MLSKDLVDRIKETLDSDLGDRDQLLQEQVRADCDDHGAWAVLNTDAAVAKLVTRFGREGRARVEAIFQSARRAVSPGFSLSSSIDELNLLLRSLAMGQLDRVFFTVSESLTEILGNGGNMDDARAQLTAVQDQLLRWLDAAVSDLIPTLDRSPNAGARAVNAADST